MMSATHAAEPIWPDLTYSAWSETLATLQLWTQIVGKIRLAQTPWLNHSWQTPLYVTVRGLGTSIIPHDAGAVDLEFDCVERVLSLRTVGGKAAAVPLAAQPMATFYDRVMTALAQVG